MFNIEDVISPHRLRWAFPKDFGKFECVVHGESMIAKNEYGTFLFECPKFPRTVVLVGESDHSMTEEIFQANRHKSKYWFSTNKQTLSVHGLPLGVSSFLPLDSLRNAMSMPRSYSNLVYMNFSIATNAEARQPVWDMFKDKPWVTAEQSVPQEHYLEQIRKHPFVICPRGNGVDTHRLWETIYLGAIPIVKRDIAHSDWMDLPVVWIDDWSQVTPEFLVSIDLSNRNTEAAKLSYWIRNIGKIRQQKLPIHYG